MPKLGRTLVALAVAFMLASCVGKEFVPIANNELGLNQTTIEEVRARLGKPQSSARSLRHGKQIRTYVYTYGSMATAKGIIVGLPSSRTQVFRFSDGRLVGYEYSSNFSDDMTRFDDSAISLFDRGVTTRSDVLDALGEPVGESVFPLVDTPGDREVVYTFTWTDIDMKIHSKTLRVVFGPDDVAKQISYAGTKPY